MMMSKLIASNAIGHSYKLSEKNPPPSCEETGFFEHINYLLDVRLNESKKIKHISRQISEKEKILDKINNKNGKIDSNLSSQYILEIIIKYVFATVHKILLKKKNILLSHIEKQLDGISVTNEFLENLPAHLAHSKQAEEEIRLIFSLESRLRMIIESSDEENLYLKLYNQTINPLIRKAKEFLINRPFNYTAHAAASKGKAASKLFRTLHRLPRKKSVVIKNAPGCHDVILLPNSRLVLKRAHKRAEEEEGLVHSMFDFYSKQGVVGIFSFQTAHAERYDIEALGHCASQKNRAILDESSDLVRAIKNRLSKGKDRLLARSKITNLSDKEKSTLKSIADKKYYLQLYPGGNFKLRSFEQLKYSYLMGEFLPLSKIGFYQGDQFRSCDLWELGRTYPVLCKYLNIFKLNPSVSIFYTPDLSLQRDKKAYELCEGVKWSYQDEEGKKHLSAFKNLHHLVLLGKVIKNITPENPGSSQLIPSGDQLIRLLNVKWKIVNNELLELYSNYKIKSLTNYQAKPFIKGLVMLEELQAFPNAMVDVFQKLVPEAEFNGILTGLFQCLDLHQRNLAVVPVANREYKKFQHLKFFVPSKNSTLSFNQLILHYLDGRIEHGEFVQFKLDGVLRSSRIIEESDLLNALSVDWKFVIFDTDLSIGEDNLLQFQRRDLCCEHLIPLRSVLLEIEWKDNRLKEETIQLLRDSEKNDRLIADWAQRADAPVRKRLSASLQKEIDQLFVHFGTDSLSSFRVHLEDFTLRELQGDFVEEFCDSEDPDISDLWVRIEEELNSPAAINGFSIADDKRRIDTQRIDLTSSTETAGNNRNKIAMQLFPRLSCRQQEALFQRQKSMRDYLRNYDELVNSELEDLELYTQLSNYLGLKETPLNTIEKKHYLFLLQCVAASSDYSRELIHLYNDICKKCQPTYFNLMKAMYPLLADAFELYTVTVSRLEYLQNHSDLETKSDEQLAGQAIGCYSAPLEEAIKIAKEKFPKENEYYILAEMIELAIINKKDPSYFGSWKKWVNA